MSDLKTVLRDLGGILIIIGVITLFALTVPVYFSEYFALSPLLITAGVFFVAGIPLYLIFKKAELANFKTAMVTAALGWFLISLIGALPFTMIGFDKTNPALTMDFLSGFFETEAIYNIHRGKV